MVAKRPFHRADRTATTDEACAGRTRTLEDQLFRDDLARFERHAADDVDHGMARMHRGEDFPHLGRAAGHGCRSHLIACSRGNHMRTSRECENEKTFWQRSCPSEGKWPLKQELNSMDALASRGRGCDFPQNPRPARATSRARRQPSGNAFDAGRQPRAPGNCQLRLKIEAFRTDANATHSA